MRKMSITEGAGWREAMSRRVLLRVQRRLGERCERSRERGEKMDETLSPFSNTEEEEEFGREAVDGVDAGAGEGVE